VGAPDGGTDRNRRPPAGAPTVPGTASRHPAPGRPCSGCLLRGPGAEVWVDAGAGTFAELRRHTDPARPSAVCVPLCAPTRSRSPGGLPRPGIRRTRRPSRRPRPHPRPPDRPVPPACPRAGPASARIASANGSVRRPGCRGRGRAAGAGEPLVTHVGPRSPPGPRPPPHGRAARTAWEATATSRAGSIDETLGRSYGHRVVLRTSYMRRDTRDPIRELHPAKSERRA
jgi:hypothetical protein